MDLANEKLHLEMGHMVEALKLTDDKQKLIRLRYGLDGKAPATLKEMVRVLKVKPKQLKKDVEEVDRLVFNYLKNRV